MQAITTIGLDIAKSVFQVHGVDAEGRVVIRRQLKRRYVLSFFEKLPPSLVGMEACASSHHWSRERPWAGSLVQHHAQCVAMSPIGTSQTSGDVRLESAKRAKADIDLIAVTNRDFMGTRPSLAAVFSSLIKRDHSCRRASHSARDFGQLEIICRKRHQVLSDPRLRARLREPDASVGQITMIFAAQHTPDNGRGTRLHQLGMISKV